MVKLRRISRLLKETIAEWQLNEVSLLASSLAYYTVFSLAPLMAIVILIVGTIFDETAVQEQLVARMSELFGSEGAQLIAAAIAYMRVDVNETEPLRLVFNLCFLLVGATGIFAQIQAALNKIWGVQPLPGRKLFNFLRKRLLTFIMVLAIAFLLLVSFFGNSIIIAFVDAIDEIVPGSGNLWQIVSLLVSFVVTTVIFALIFSVLPDAEIDWRDTLVGAIVTAILFLVGQFFFGLFLGQTNFGSAYGVAGSFVIVITWIFYAAHILLLGAEFTKVFAKHRGSPIVPSDYAVKIACSRRKLLSKFRSNRYRR